MKIMILKYNLCTCDIAYEFKNINIHNKKTESVKQALGYIHGALFLQIFQEKIFLWWINIRKNNLKHEVVCIT